MINNNNDNKLAVINFITCSNAYIYKIDILKENK